MKNNLLNETLSYNGEIRIPTNIDITAYSPKGVNKESTRDWSADRTPFNAKDTYWIRVDGLNDTSIIQKISNHIDLDFLLTQDILNINHPPKIEEYDDFVLIVIKYFQKNEDDEYIPFQISLILGKNYLISFCEKHHSFLDEVYSAIENNVLRIRQRGADYLLSVIINSIIANHTTALMELNDSLDDIEDELLTIKSSKNFGAIIQEKRREYIKFKKAILPLKDQYARLLRTNNALISPANKAFFNDVNDHLQYVLQNIDMGKESLTSLVELYMSNNDLKMNDIMKRLTIVSTIFIPLTFLVGVWGMNFTGMTELSWRYGYEMAWTIMIIIGLIIYFYFRIKKWY